MAPLTIDRQGITPDLLRPTDSSALRGALQERPAADGAGFDNRRFDNKAASH